jgi:hypothetical protein
MSTDINTETNEIKSEPTDRIEYGKNRRESCKI